MRYISILAVVSLLLLFSTEFSVAASRGGRVMLDREGIRVEFVNPKDSRELSSVGVEKIFALVRDGKIVKETLNGDFSEWRPYYEKEPHITVTTKNFSLILAVETRYTHFAWMLTPRADGRVVADKVTVPGFRLDDYLSGGSAAPHAAAVGAESSYFLEVDANKAGFEIRINGNVLASSEPSDSKRHGYPLNRFLVLGKNLVEARIKPDASRRGSVQIRVFDRFSPQSKNAVEFRIMADTPSAKKEFTISNTQRLKREE